MSAGPTAARRWMKPAALGVAAFAALSVPIALRLAPRVQPIGGLGMGGTTDYLWGLAWAVVLAGAVALLPVPRRDRQALLLVWAAKCVAALGIMLAYEARYNDELDAYYYYYHGVPGYTAPGWRMGGGIDSVYELVWLLHWVVPDSYHAMKVTFSFIGLLAIYLLCRAARLAWPLLGPGTLAFVGLFPSVLFFSSILGKDPVVLLGIAGMALGAAGLWRLRLWAPLPLFGGALLVGAVRSWLVPIFLLPTVLVALAALPRTGWGRRAGALGKALAIVAVAVAAILLAAEDTTVVQDGLAKLNDQSRRWAEGGSGQTPPEFDHVWVALAFLPWGLFTALVRPLPGDAGGAFGLLAGLEGLALLALAAFVVLDLRARGTARRLAHPAALWVVLAVLAWGTMYAFVSYQNLGTALRFRLQVLPLLLLLGAAVLARPVRAPPAGDRLRVLLLTPTYRPLVGGVETALHELAVHLAAAGHEVDVVTPRLAGPAFEEPAPGLRVFREGRPLRSRPLKLVLYQWWAVRRAARLDAQRPYDVALLTYAIHASLAQPWLRWRLRLPTVVEEIHLGTGAEVSHASENPRVLDPLLRATYRGADAVVVQSRDTGSFVETVSGRTDWTLIAQGTYPDRFHPDRRDPALRARFGDPRHLLVTASRLSGRKNVGDMLAAFARLRARDDAHLVVAGDGPERPALERRAQELGIAGRVTFTGFLADGELQRLLASSDLFLSTATYEAFGLSIVDAMACGLPVVAYDARGPNDYLRDGEAGRVLPHDVDAFARAVDGLLADERLRRRMGAAARAAIVDGGYTWRANAERHAELLLRVARREAPRP